MGMRAFHADQMQHREAFKEPIIMAQGAVAMAGDAVETARHHWQQASQAAENLQELSTTMARSAMRDLERRQEQDRDEIAAARAMTRQD
jgi:flagellar biosynthesis chaperone FliJ